MADIEVVKYDSSYELQWDNFINTRACNGTFLQSRLFLGYHPEGKFEDDSLMFFMKGQLVAVCPACAKYEDGIKIFSSHAGSTYGGLVVSKELLRAEKMLALIDAFEDYLSSQGYGKCLLKQNNPLMNTEPMDLIDFCLYYRGYREYKELDIYIDYSRYDKENIISNFSKLKKRQIKKCIDAELRLRNMNGLDDMSEFIRILSLNLEKYGLTPYHTAEDLMNLKSRFPNEIEFWGAEVNGRIIAEAMVFLLEKSGCVHTHYLAADPEYASLNGMTFIYYSMIDCYVPKGYKTLSWGITSEHFGIDINHNLTNTKEEFGSRHNVVSIYEKEFNKL